MSWPRRFLRVVWQRRETNWWFALIFGAAFAIVQVVGHLHHEMWRDELHCWAIGRNSSGLWDLLTGERRYDGHPFLWYYLLHLASRLIRSYVALEVVGASLAVASSVLWLRYAPVPRALRVLLLGSYYIVFEYGIMNRSYTLGLLLIFTFCALYHPYRKQYLLLGIVLALLSATSLYGTLLAIALGFFLFSVGPKLRRPDDRDGQWRVALPVDWALGLAVACAGIVVTALTTWPPSDAVYSPAPAGPVTEDVVRALLSQYWRGMFPFSGLRPWDWPGNDALFSQSAAGVAAMPWLAAIWLVLLLVALRRSPRVAATYGLGALLMATAQHTIYGAGWRHLGHYFILLVACLWLYARETRGRAPDGLLHGLFVVNLSIQVLTGAQALATDYRQAFSRSAEAAQFIQHRHLEGRPIVAAGDDPVTPVAVVLDRPFYFPATGETTDVTVFHNRRSPQAQILDQAGRLARAGDGSALIVADYDIGPATAPGIVTTLLYTSGPAIMADETYRIYDVKAQ